MSRLTLMVVAAGTLAAVVMLSVAAMSRESGGGAADATRARSEARSAAPASSFTSMSAVATTMPPTQPVSAVAPPPSPSAATRTAGPVIATTKAANGAAPAPVALPAEFAILQTRSPFGRGPKKPGPNPAAGPEASFVLKGVVDVGGRLTAFVEEIPAKRVLQVSTGDSLARGRVRGVTLDAIEYDAAGAAKRIEVGQNLMGQVVPPTPTSKPAGAPGQPGQPGQPGMPQPGQPGMPPGAVSGRPGGPGQPVPVPAPGQ